MFSFPLQVISFSPLPSLFPYFILLLIILLNYLSLDNNKIISFNNVTAKIILIYLFIILFNTSWQIVFNFISFNDAISSIIIYVFPVFLYFYFYSTANTKEIQYVIIAIGFCGAISSIYYIYDSYGMLVLGKVNDFSYKMIEYVGSRSGSMNVNDARVSAYYRSHGLLESHAISSAWIAFSGFSLLSILPKNKIILRSIFTTLFLVLLVASFNFTSILSFIIAIFLVEYSGFSLIKAIVNKYSLKSLSLTFFLVLISTVFFIYSFPEFISVIQGLLSYQTDLLFGRIAYGRDEGTFVSNLIQSYLSFFNNILKFPPGILIGDGFSTWGVSPEGGDYGHAETLTKFGLPLYIIVFLGFIRIALSALNKINKNNFDKKINGHLKFSLSIIIYIFISSFHYSTWSSKSTLPILMLSLGIIIRYKSIKNFNSHN